MNRIRRLLLALCLCAPAHAAPMPEAVPCCRVLNLSRLPVLDEVMPVLLDKQVVFVGESHDRYEHHLAQLEIIRRIHRAHPEMAIALELFAQPSQGDLDDYVAGRIDEATMLRRVGYFKKGGGLDYRLYRPILRFAHDQGIPLLALNLPDEISRKVARGGLHALAEAERRWVPGPIEPADEPYRARLDAAFSQHPPGMRLDFENFLTAQLLKDEAMAERAADYLRQRPGCRLVLLAGSGHLVRGEGIPRRLLRRLPISSAIVLNNPGLGLEFSVDMADFLLFPEPQELPAAGRVGAKLSEDQGQLKVDGLEPDSAAGAAGVLAGDRLLALNGLPLTDMAALNAALLDSKPGDQVQLRVRRPGSQFAPEREQEIAVTLR